ncbi:MAG TPA: nitrite/sulfite reductase [Steroidobacteraceae bacterium]|nr:nitrite/sulfite reductase [Steroidobacteraceae bacterium]
MYRYDQIDRTLVAERVAQFRDQTRRFLAGELTEEEFRPLRLRNGLYIQTHAPMLRIAVPYGLLAADQVRMLAHIARHYDRGYGHFTTRQNIQFNWPELARVPDILAELATVEMHAIQTSGNCIRNVTSDHLAGIAPDEIADPRPYCEIIRQWSTVHPEFTYLPRKFKIAVTGSPADRAASEVHDIGLHMVRSADGELGFEVLAGGGLGRQPIIGQRIREFLAPTELLAYLEAILRVYNRHGRRDNINKARIKVLVKALGATEFARQVEAEYAANQAFAARLPEAEIERVRACFAPLPYEPLPDMDVVAGRGAAFAAWYAHNTRAHKISGYRAVFISLKQYGAAPGDASAAQLDAIAAAADEFSFGQVRVTHDQNLVLGEVRQRDVPRLWERLNQHGLATPNIGTLTDIICCPGLDFCSLANAGSIPVAKQIQARFSDFDYLYDLGHIEIKISGCMNACGHHHIGHIGILGVDKHGEEWYQITIGGSSSGRVSLGEVIGPSVPKEAVAETLASILDVYVEERDGAEESFLETVRRIGIEPFKERAYAADYIAA